LHGVLTFALDVERALLREDDFFGCIIAEMFYSMANSLTILMDETRRAPGGRTFPGP
jgi:hypothetical protein